MLLKDILTSAKEKTKEAKVRRTERKEKKEGNSISVLSDYFLFILSEEAKKNLPFLINNSALYKFANDCKLVGITELGDQKRVLKFFVENWDKIRSTIFDLNYARLEPYPNLFEISLVFFKIGYLSSGFGLNINSNKFKKEKQNG